MKINTGDIWDYIGRVHAICITTNGVVKQNGQLVMGAGVALQAKQRFPRIDLWAGQHVRNFGNIPGVLSSTEGTSIVSFPTKHNYRDNSDIQLILNSAVKLRELADQHNWRYVVMPPPGCGLGGLKLSDVKPKLDEVLDDRFWIMRYPPQKRNASQ